MAIEVKVPAIGESVKQATLLRWYKKDGDTLEVDEPICELETDKANVDVPAAASGILKRLKNEGDQVNVGETIAQIDASANGGSKAPAAAKKESKAAATSAPSPLPVATEELNPAVQKLIKDNNLNPASIPASGAGGRLTKEDVTAYLVARGGNGGTSPVATGRKRASCSPRNSGASRCGQLVAEAEQGRECRPAVGSGSRGP